MDRFREIEAFVAVVDAGSFVKAAEALNASKAAVSRAVLELEARLGARLLQRTTRRLSLTEAGREYYARCRQILGELEEADGVVGMASGQAVGTLRINVPVSFGILHLAPLWGALMARHPGLEIDVTLADRQVDLVDEGYDMAVRITRPADSSLVYRRFATTRVVMCASPAYLARRGTPQSVAELARHEVVAYTYKAGGDLWRFDTPHGTEEVMTHARLRANNGETCRAAALDGQGIVLQPTFLVSEDLATGRLVEILPDCRGPEIGIYAVYPSRRHLSMKVRVTVDFLAACFEQTPWAS